GARAAAVTPATIFCCPVHLAMAELLADTALVGCPGVPSAPSQCALLNSQPPTAMSTTWLVCICVCFTTVENESIYLAIYKTKTCLFFQRITHHSVWDEMKSLSGVRMKSPPLTPTTDLESCVFFLVLSLCFSPLMYFLSQNVSREKRKLKEVMKTMGLRDTAFWLSWGLLYAVFVLLVSCMLGLLLKNLIFEMSSFSALFLLFFCYGISSICFCFMISALLKKPKTTCFAVFVLIFSFGALSLLTLINLLPAALEWILSLCCPFAFGAAISKVECYALFGIGNATLNVPVLALPKLYHVFLIFLLDKYGVPYPATFFLKKSYWRRSGSSYTWDAPTNEQNHGNIFSDNAEPVPPEFDGKEAIRINNIKKTYKVKKMETEALRGLSLNIYEGQITAVLGHSGAGKTTLLNILSGLSQPSDGSTTICTYNISKREDMKQIREMLGVCPQFNIQFEFLTVKENLKTFAKIKGIPSKDVDKEVQNILTLLDIGAIQDTQANRLSGGQKRKLSLGITFLGDPQVLLLDEPTAGLDPYSRHLVWALLNERKAGRVTLFTTQFMDEADILADRKAFISRGRLTCVGSSLFLKKKWGIGYHLRLHVNELCDSERITSLVQLYIPAAKLSGQRENELSYTLPLENLNKFPGNYQFKYDHCYHLSCLMTRSQLRVSGLFPSAYLCGQALVDVPLTCFLLVLLLWPWYARFSYSDAKLNFTMVFCSNPVIIVHNLRKEYKCGEAGPCSCFKKHKKGKKVATRTVSLCVKKGEVLGLLGPNGAGKSTTVNMIIGETDLTAGEVVETEEDTAEFLGHCPQENALWPNLTVKEHLEIYAAVKGIRKEAAAITINRYGQHKNNLDLQEHLKKPTKTLSAGLSRKLCFAMSLLGSPTVLLLDESTTGMDPRGKRQVWKTIRTILKDKDQGAILTTHHMEDAEAVCDRVAIMVAGQLRCLGSIQYLKSKFGKNYLLQIKVKGLEQGELLNTRILQMFPQAARQERISTLLVYKVPMEDALPLSKAFSMLEEGRSALSVWTEHVKRLYMCNGPVTALIPD
uniref:ABC transporter domain-containing protein n=1 Tax=Varanus komodoensis TaxID=61221 RepID=A0A8D2JFK5_VARKO